jgi:hypothetical protein
LHQDSSVARDAIAAFEAATANEQKACLTFILFKNTAGYNSLARRSARCSQTRSRAWKALTARPRINQSIPPHAIVVRPLQSLRNEACKFRNDSLVLGRALTIGGYLPEKRDALTAPALVIGRSSDNVPSLVRKCRVARRHAASRFTPYASAQIMQLPSTTMRSTSVARRRVARRCQRRFWPLLKPENGSPSAARE